jgi:YidC/Oxa1 family membrane protein insertase
MFMPEPANEQAAMQQKVMKWMMVVMSIFFYKVPSGLCLYLIASSLWGIAERKLVPPPGSGTGGVPAAPKAPGDKPGSRWQSDEKRGAKQRKATASGASKSKRRR